VEGVDALPPGWVVDDRARALAEHFWPGALTLVLPADAAGADAAGADAVAESQAFRAPDHAVTLALIRAAGPLLATSANLSDEPDTLDADDVLVAFATHADQLDAVVDGGRVPGGVASTVLDLTVEPARMLRHGPISSEALGAVVEVAAEP
jgi:L-threonylcarbamoyladenylate synthase